MSRLEEILDTARLFAGSLTDEQTEVLSRLCAAAEQSFTDRLREGVQPEDCHEALVCASAWMALSNLSGVRGADGVERFTVGALTVERSTGAERCLAMQAELMMAPYLRNTAFQFRGV